MPVATQLSLAEYLSTSYEPDCDYIDGVLEQRNVGMRRHSRTQALLSSWLLARERQHGHRVLVEQRMQVSPTRVRIPDICLVPADDVDELTQRPPVLCIEILSPEDRWSRMQERLTDYLSFGVPMIWIIDAYSGEAWSATQDKPVAPVRDGKLRCAELDIEVAVSDILPQD